MGRKKKALPQNNILRVFLFLFATPLVIFKWIGDILIFFGKIHLFFWITTYKVFSKIFYLFKTPIYKAFSLFLNFKNKLRLETGKEKVIFQFSKSTSLRVKKYRFKMPKFKRPRVRLPRFPAWLRLLILKIKFFSLGVLITALITLIYLGNVFISSLPNPVSLKNRDIPATSKIYDRNGKLLYEIYAEENRTPIKLSEIPEAVKQATIAIEDREFFAHKGLSVRGLLRAIIHNLTTDTLEGGSTITQQLIRSSLLTPEKTFARKIKEIILAIWAEQMYSKEQILEMYLNQVPYGGTAWGIESASQTYFGKNVTKLSLAETAFLAGLPVSPTRFSPYGSHPQAYKSRQEEVLKKMVEQGYITRQQADQTRQETITFKPQTTAIAAPHFVMYIKDLLEKEYGIRIVERGGLRVTTTLDLPLQEMVQKTISTHLESLKSLNVGNGAALITNPKTGEILAMVGSKDYFNKEKEGNFNVTTSLRQTGSSIKVVNYAAALSLGFTTASIISDAPITYQTPGQIPYTPINYDGRFHGRIPLRVALASSYNVPAVKILSQIGLKAMIEQGKLMGITSWEDESRFGLSLTLGGGEVSMLDMAKVYGTLANGGLKRELTPFIKITDYKGENLPLPTLKGPLQATSPEIAFILSSILSDNTARTPAFGPASALVIPGKTVAVKTGTSDNKRDNWTIGYTPDYAVTVWVGNNDNSPMHPTLTSGVTGAAPIWNEIMKNLLQDIPDKPFRIPSDIVSLPCYGKVEYFIRGTEPAGGCPRFPTNTPIPTN